MPGLEYEGESFWASKPRTFTPTLDSRIKHFAILLRLSNLEPICTEKDELDHLKSRRTTTPYYYETWMSVAVNPDWYRAHSLQHVKDLYVNEDAFSRRSGPFTLEPEPEFGLAHIVSPHPVADSLEHRDWGHDFYFDEATKSTFIHCTTEKKVVEPYSVYTTCNHYFILEDLKAVVDAVYTKADIHRWREIEEKLRRMFRSFIVRQQ